MASTSEAAVLKVVADELHQMPVRGAEHRGKMEKMIDILREMAEHKSYESGWYHSLDDAMEMVKFYRAKRARFGLRGRRASAEIDLEPGHKLPAQHRGRVHKSETGAIEPATILSQEEVDDLQFNQEHPPKKRKVKRLTAAQQSNRFKRQAAGRKIKKIASGPYRGLTREQVDFYESQRKQDDGDPE